MSRLIKIKTEEHGELDIALQQYAVALYIAINKDGRMVEQFGSDMTEEEFIAQLHEDENIEVLLCL